MQSVNLKILLMSGLKLFKNVFWLFQREIFILFNKNDTTVVSFSKRLAPIIRDNEYKNKD